MFNNIYWEANKKNLCRMHSLNSYFGKPFFNPNSFEKLCEDYNEYIKNTYNEIVKSSEYDIFPQLNLISYAIWKYDNSYCLTIPINLSSKQWIYFCLN